MYFFKSILEEKQKQWVMTLLADVHVARNLIKGYDPHPQASECK